MSILLDALAIYLLTLKYLTLFVALLLLLFGLDDLFVDLVYWSRRIWRALTVYRRHKPATSEHLFRDNEKPLAIMLPAWHEHDVIAQMVDLSARTLDYENYHIFVGTYPNDPDTQAQVDKACARHPNVHKVVCVLPGPTSKADCLNNIISSILDFEQRVHIQFAGFILHDAEDIVSPLELRLFNLLVERKDLLQLPVYPLPGRWYQFTRSHYLDEFAENHGKDVVVREALTGQIPSAGVGTCFSRRAIFSLLSDGNGIVFDVKSLTEDYDIGFRLSMYGLHGAFVRYEDLPNAVRDQALFTIRNAVIGVREYFPDRWPLAVRQKARWIVGIVFQGIQSLRWSDNWLVNYFLWRDRRGVLTNLVSMLSLVIVLQLTLIPLLYWFKPDAWHFPALIEPGSPTWYLLMVNGMFFIIRAMSRAYFVYHSYGWFEGLLSFPRTLWGIFINFLAQLRAIRQVVAAGRSRVAWDKTQHEFPVIADDSHLVPLGERLVAKGWLSTEALPAALADATRAKMKLGYFLVHSGRLSTHQLAEVLAEQAGVPPCNLDAWNLSPSLIAQVPGALALKYCVLPIAEEGDVLILARETRLTPVTLTVLERRLGRPLQYRMAALGQVTVGLRHWYARQKKGYVDPHAQLEDAIQAGKLTQEQGAQLWESYVSRQTLLGDFLLSRNLLEPQVFNQALIAFNRSDLPLGQFLVEQGILSADALETALALQKAAQVDMATLLADYLTTGRS